MLKLKKIHHLVRYFAILGVLVFIGYLQRWQDDAFLLLIGPSIYLAEESRQLASILWEAVPNTQNVNFYGFLLPVTLLYFGFLGFLFKQIWNERGFIRFLTLFALIFFLIFVHYKSWNSLSGYFTFR